MRSATRLTSKGQIVIPKPVREQLRWVSGTELAVEVLGDGAVRLTLLEAGNPIDALYGCLKGLPGASLSRISKPSTKPKSRPMSAGNVAVVDVFEAARVKAMHPLSYADAFAVATGRLEKAPVLTGDPEILGLPATVVRVRRLDRHT